MNAHFAKFWDFVAGWAEFGAKESRKNDWENKESVGGTLIWHFGMHHERYVQIGTKQSQFINKSYQNS